MIAVSRYYANNYSADTGILSTRSEEQIFVPLGTTLSLSLSSPPCIVAVVDETRREREDFTF